MSTNFRAGHTAATCRTLTIQRIPVTIGDESQTVRAGVTLTDDVPPGAMVRLAADSLRSVMSGFDAERMGATEAEDWPVLGGRLARPQPRTGVDRAPRQLLLTRCPGAAAGGKVWLAGTFYPERAGKGPSLAPYAGVPITFRLERSSDGGAARRGVNGDGGDRGGDDEHVEDGWQPVSEWFGLVLEAAPADHLEAFLDSAGNLATGLFDRYLNPVAADISGLDVALPNGQATRIELPQRPGAYGAVRVSLPSLEPGSRVTVRDARGREAVSSPAPLRSIEGERLLFGEFHWHTEASGDGCRPVDDAYRSARDGLLLDYAGAADHFPFDPPPSSRPNGLSLRECADIVDSFNAPDRHIHSVSQGSASAGDGEPFPRSRARGWADEPPGPRALRPRCLAHGLRRALQARAAGVRAGRGGDDALRPDQRSRRAPRHGGRSSERGGAVAALAPRCRHISIARTLIRRQPPIIACACWKSNAVLRQAREQASGREQRMLDGLPSLSVGPFIDGSASTPVAPCQRRGYDAEGGSRRGDRAMPAGSWFPARRCHIPNTSEPGGKEVGPMRYVIRERFFRLGEDSDVTDEAGRPVLHIDGKVLTLRDTLVLQDAEGREVARVHRRLLALRPTYEITVGSRELAEVRQHFFTPFGDRFTIDVPGPDDLELRGNLLDHEFTIWRGDRTVATVSKRWLALRDTYGVEIAEGEDWLLLLACVLALDLAEERERRQERE